MRVLIVDKILINLFEKSANINDQFVSSCFENEPGFEDLSSYQYNKKDCVLIQEKLKNLEPKKRVPHSQLVRQIDKSQVTEVSL